MLLIGLALIFGIGIMPRRTRRDRVDEDLLHGHGDLAGAQPVLDEHIVHAIVLAGIAYVGAGRYRLGKYWERLSLVKRLPILK